MTGRSTAIQRAQILRGFLLKHGCPEVSIEVLNGRPGSGDTWNLCRPFGVQSHHIVSTPTVDRPTPGLWLVKNGRSDLPGPLCNGTAGVDLVYRIICMGMANHPGYGGPITLRGPLGNYTVPKDNGRPYLWGTEWEGGLSDAVWDRKYRNRRTGVEMTFREFMGRCNAGLVEGIWAINGRGKRPNPSMDLSGYHLEHSTWTSRKIDRRNYSTQRGRDELRKYDNSEPLPRIWFPNMKAAAEGKIDKPLHGVQKIERELERKYGVKLKVDGLWGKRTTEAYKKHQEAIGSAPRFCDGVPGPKDLNALVAGRYFVAGT